MLGSFDPRGRLHNLPIDAFRRFDVKLNISKGDSRNNFEPNFKINFCFSLVSEKYLRKKDSLKLLPYEVHIFWFNFVSAYRSQFFLTESIRNFRPILPAFAHQHRSTVP